MSLQRVAHHRGSERGTNPHGSSGRGGALVPLPLPLPLLCRASRRSLSSLPDICGLPVVTSSWRAIKSLDEAYKEVKPGVFVVLWMYVDVLVCTANRRNKSVTLAHEQRGVH